MLLSTECAAALLSFRYAILKYFTTFTSHSFHILFPTDQMKGYVRIQAEINGELLWYSNDLSPRIVDKQPLPIHKFRSSFSLVCEHLSLFGGMLSPDVG